MNNTMEEMKQVVEFLMSLRTFKYLTPSVRRTGHVRTEEQMRENKKQ